MEDWEYSELLEAVREIYDNLLNEDRGYKYAIARTFYEFETVCNEGKTENLLVHLAIGEIILTHPKVFVGVVDTIKKELASIDMKELEKELSSEDVDNLLTRINHVNNKLNNVLLDYDPDAANY
ncbi:Imm3 family immunity protein [Bacillus sonorensis]|uniref:Imm3 family immunity protein n=1 Tax=Bacillus sonorensis TaxID=119858 RepID=UPI000496AD75|nr:Imm3 family immunity protein [Bacillus sonorensis]MCF7619669.1 immunity protein Imm3 [Bacillus sonorensis]MCY7859252.1 Imm3 family immunity protein [Bacillus sonorensis]MCY8027813.1 Imm3 family immunity protein [Bacillus sonorensis]MCY8036376.1 Imm3 family immunity protein [Bacillus sonorensis]MCY8273135.1 Imm3 family immunity protein [Bacillus sonorensis]